MRSSKLCQDLDEDDIVRIMDSQTITSILTKIIEKFDDPNDSAGETQEEFDAVKKLACSTFDYRTVQELLQDLYHAESHEKRPVTLCKL